MKVFVGGVTSERQYTKSLFRFVDLVIRDGDQKVVPGNVLRGDAARIELCDEFLEGDKDAILMLDMDMAPPNDMLEKLRKHDLDAVTAHYWKRQFPMESICGISSDDTWPYIPLDPVPTKGLHEVVTTGFGCVLIKREVVEAVKDSLPKGDHPFALGTTPEMAHGELHFGADFRFFHLVRKLGYKLWLDAEVESLHAMTMWLGRFRYDKNRDTKTEAEELARLYALNKHLHGNNQKTLELKQSQLKKTRLYIDEQLQALKHKLN